MEGDATPGRKQAPAAGGGFGRRGAMWWRPPGYFSGPLLANAQFRKLFLSRTKEILETVYTEEKLGPLIDAMADRLKPEARLRAELFDAEPDRASERFDQTVQRLREHLTKRREFLLAQEEIKNAGPFSTAGLELPAATKPKKKPSAKAVTKPNP